MSKYVNDLGSRLFHSVADRAGNLGEKFEEEFSFLAQNVTKEVNLIVDEAVSLSPYIKVALVCISIFLTLLSIRLLAYGIRVLVNKRRRQMWIHFEYEEQTPPVILMMSSDDGSYNPQLLSKDFSRRLMKDLPNQLDGENSQRKALLNEIHLKKSQKSLNNVLSNV